MSGTDNFLRGAGHPNIGQVEHGVAKEPNVIWIISLTAYMKISASRKVNANSHNWG